MTTLLQGYVDRQAERRPDATAVVFREERTTYGRLAAASNQLARLLKEGGCQRGDRVCMLMPKSRAAIVSMLGILKADCVYVPLDPAGPAPRLARVVAATEPRWILASGPVAALLDDLLQDAGGRTMPAVGWMDDEHPVGTHFRAAFGQADLAAYAAEPLCYAQTSSDAAHILFTSGSTGQPKGVVITHANVSSFVEWAQAHFGITWSDRISGHSPLHFDLSTFDIYGTFAAGAELHLVPPELNLLAPRLASFIRTSELTQWFSVPSVLTYILKFDVLKQDDFPMLRRLMWCGEVFPTPALNEWMRRLPHVTFTNLYGPTEASVASSYYTVPPGTLGQDQAVPIGQPCSGEELMVLDESLRPVVQGQIGDLYIGGVGLSPGYWHDPDQTAAVFRTLPGDPPKRVYKTGDLAHVGPDSLVYYHGRSDAQIKSRGYRIELGEIEAALNATNGVRECAVVSIATSGFEGASICCAYVPASGMHGGPATIRKALAGVLPTYMLPNRWLELERLPRNMNGKVDRNVLQERFRAQQ